MSKAVIIYDSRGGNTGMMAKAIEEGMKKAGIEVSSKRTINATAGTIRDADAVVLGSPTYHKDMIASIKTSLFEMEKADLTGKVGTAFGSYGWSGESGQMMTDTVKHIFGMKVREPGLRMLHKPSEYGLKQCQEFDGKIGETIKVSKLV